MRTPWRWLSESARNRWTSRFTPLWAQMVLHQMGIRVRCIGPRPPEGALLAPNHSSYLDIPVLASQTPCLFLSKAEIADWPVFGSLMRSSSHLHFARRSPRELRAAIDAVSSKLASGARVCVFLEGTTHGKGMLPFRSSFLAATQASNAQVVPVGIRYHVPPGVDFAEDVAYWKDHQIGAHAWRLLGLRGIEAEVRFGEPRRLNAGCRKQGARTLQDAVLQLLR